MQKVNRGLTQSVRATTKSNFYHGDAETRRKPKEQSKSKTHRSLKASGSNCAGANRRGTHNKPLRRARDVSEGITGNQRQCVVWGRREQSHILWIDNTDLIHRISPLLQSAATRLKPLDQNRIA